jgi:hypothetical protein
MEEFAVKIRDNAHIYIHNTLQNAAWFLKQEIENLIKENGDGIGLKIMPCLVMLAFAFEARVNFLGHKAYGESWQEKQPYLQKVKRIARKLGMQLNFPAL